MADNTLLTAIKNYQIKNYKDAFPAFKKLAKNQTEAAYYLGMMFYHGQSTNQDYHQAYKYFQQAWEGLYPNAIYMLGVCNENGRGTEKNLIQAFEYYQAAAKNNSELALLKIAKFYETGIVVHKSLKTAIEIYVKLTKVKNAFAMYKIGAFYLEGKGLKKSVDNAYNWLNKALAEGSQEAMNYFRFLGSKSKTDIRSSEAVFMQAKAYLNKEKYENGILLLEIAAKEKHLEAILRLSDCYYKGIGVKKDPKKGFSTLLKYKEINQPRLDYIIGQKYEFGKGTNSSFVKAALFYELAAKNDYQPSIKALKEIRGY